MRLFRIDIDHFYLQLQWITIRCAEESIGQEQFVFQRIIIHTIIKGIKFRGGNADQAGLITCSFINQLLISPSRIHKTTQRHVFIDSRLVLSENKHFPIRFKGYVILKIFIQDILHSDLTDHLLAFVIGIMQSVIKAEQIFFRCFVFIKKVYKDAVLVLAVFFLDRLSSR